MRMRTKTRTGSRSSSLLFVSLILISLLIPGSLTGKKKEKLAAEPFAIIAGTTFRPPGLSLPAARVRVRVETGSANVSAKSVKPQEATTDSRGEFAVRVPAVPSKWTVDVTASGYQTQSKSVAIEGEQRVELSFVLEPDAGKKK